MVTAFFEIYCLCNQEERQAFFAQLPQEESPEQLRILKPADLSMGRGDGGSEAPWAASTAQAGSNGSPTRPRMHSFPDWDFKGIEGVGNDAGKAGWATRR